jgi:hypothetical protein
VKGVRVARWTFDYGSGKSGRYEARLTFRCEGEEGMTALSAVLRREFDFEPSGTGSDRAPIAPTESAPVERMPCLGCDRCTFDGLPCPTEGGGARVMTGPWGIVPTESAPVETCPRCHGNGHPCLDEGHADYAPTEGEGKS